MQQINLYDPALQKQFDPWTSRNLLLALGAVGVLCLTWGGWAQWRKSTAEAGLAEITPRLQMAQRETSELTKRVADYKPDSRLERELNEAAQRLEMRTEVLGILQKGLSAEATQQADWLRGLARQAPQGLWLTGFTLNTDTDVLEIRGRTLDPAMIAEYVQRLNAEPAFKGRTFAALNITTGNTSPAEDKNAAVAKPNPAAALPNSKPAGAAAPAPQAPATNSYKFHEFALTSGQADQAAKPGARP